MRFTSLVLNNNVTYGFMVEIKMILLIDFILWKRKNLLIEKLEVLVYNKNIKFLCGEAPFINADAFYILGLKDELVSLIFTLKT